jgi:uncharacterized protein YceK
MRSSKCLMLRATPLLAQATSGLPAGLTFPTGGSHSDTVESVNHLPTTDRGVKSSSIFPEPNTAVYDSAFLPWTYFEPVKVSIEKMPAPEKKYYQRLTRKPWDVSSTEWMEISARKRYVGGIYYACLIGAAMFVLPKERSFSGEVGQDGWFVNLPKNKSHYFA